MDLSTEHETARYDACRLPALNASLSLLAQDTQASKIELYSDPVPTAPGDAPTGDLVVTLTMTATAGTVDNALFQIQLDVPIEAQITGADPTTGTTVTWARVYGGDGTWWGDATVSDEAGAGEIKLQTTLLYNGAYCRLTSAIFQG
jgi:hypothetical protein